jgi:signal transduction histidine kinase
VVRIKAIEEGEFYRFSVTDNGPGVPPEFHDRIWEMFQTLEPRDRVEGTGIGLALVKKTVESCRGRVWMETHGELGTTFSFLWPKHPPKGEQ